MTHPYVVMCWSRDDCSISGTETREEPRDRFATKEGVEILADHTLRWHVLV